MSFLDFLSLNWALIIVAITIVVVLLTTIQFSRRTSISLFITTFLILLLSVVNYIETYLGTLTTFNIWRAVLTAIKYSIPPFVLAQVGLVIFDSKSKLRFLAYIPGLLLLILCLVSISTGIVFYFTDTNSFQRGPLGYSPFIVDGLGLAFLIYCIVRKGIMSYEDIVPIAFIGLCSIFAIVSPLVLQDSFEQWVPTTIAVGVLVYCIFLLQQLTKRDPMTKLLNRQTYYNDIEKKENLTKVVIFIDMNGLKKINDSEGHVAGDNAILKLSECLIKSTRYADRVYRIGGDEFIIFSRNKDNESVDSLINRIKTSIKDAGVSASIGYCVVENGMSYDEAYKKADEMMYIEKNEYYKTLDE